MPSWYIEPRDPLIVRDGRPFGPDPGARARSIAFPVPSTTTGGLRNRAGLKDGVFDQSQANIDRVLGIYVRGPLLAALRDDGTLSEWLPPAPADALLLRYEPTDDQRKAAKEEKAHLPDSNIVRLMPLAKTEGASYSPPGDTTLALVGPRVAVTEKPLSGQPRFWRWNDFEAWLTSPVEGLRRAETLGITGPLAETRTHVGVDPTTQTAEDGRLFQTSGLEFTSKHGERLALVVESASALEDFATGGFAPLGGERRLMAWRPGAPELPACPDIIRASILTQRTCRLVLLTPAHFTDGYRPTWLLGALSNVPATLVAAVVQRSQVISGWDMNASNGPGKPRGKPKETRRLAPAGSVYFLRLPNEVDATDDAINAWIDAIWMRNVSDREQDQRDGFGLAVLGTWDGEMIAIEVK